MQWFATDPDGRIEVAHSVAFVPGVCQSAGEGIVARCLSKLAQLYLVVGESLAQTGR